MFTASDVHDGIHHIPRLWSSAHIYVYQRRAGGQKVILSKACCISNVQLYTFQGIVLS